MLPKNSSSNTYLKKEAKKEKKASVNAANEARAEKSRAAEEKWFAHMQKAKRQAENAARRSGAITIAEQAKVKEEFFEKKKWYEYMMMVNAPNTNRLPANAIRRAADDWDESAEEDDDIGNGNKGLGRIKGAEKSKRWSSSLLMD